MNKTRYLQIVFDKTFQSYDIPKLRAAIIEKTKRESNLFHNHLGDKTFVYRYPLIQYKIKDKKPCLICLREATDDIHYLLRSKDFTFDIQGETYNFGIEEIKLRYEHIQTWDKKFNYSLLNYIALNQENYSVYKKLDSFVEKVQFIEDMLQKHINIFAHEMEAYFPHELYVKITDLKGEKHIKYKGIYHITFTLNFKSNLYIPDYIGIGKGTSVGFGIIKRINLRDEK